MGICRGIYPGLRHERPVNAVIGSCGDGRVNAGIDAGDVSVTVAFHVSETESVQSQWRRRRRRCGHRRYVR